MTADSNTLTPNTPAHVTPSPPVPAGTHPIVDYKGSLHASALVGFMRESFNKGFSANSFEGMADLAKARLNEVFDKLVYSLDQFNPAEHKAIAQYLINEGHGDLVIDNFDKFHGLTDWKVIAVDAEGTGHNISAMRYQNPHFDVKGPVLRPYFNLVLVVDGDVYHGHPEIVKDDVIADLLDKSTTHHMLTGELVFEGDTIDLINEIVESVRPSTLSIPQAPPTH